MPGSPIAGEFNFKSGGQAIAVGFTDQGLSPHVLPMADEQVRNDRHRAQLALIPPTCKRPERIRDQSRKLKEFLGSTPH
jgi:hypothetical protein